MPAKAIGANSRQYNCTFPVRFPLSLTPTIPSLLSTYAFAQWSLPVSSVSLASGSTALFQDDQLLKQGDPLGANREVKKAVEAYWAGKISADQLTHVAADVKKTNWTTVKSKGVDFVPRSVLLSLASPIKKSC